jgi:hydrophobic/amphiphilic exporter-1 (mainly G- bacteria), HAE1 family
VSLFPGVSKFLFGTLGLTVVLSLLASYLVAMSVVPLFCALFIVRSEGSSQKRTGRVQAMLRRVHTDFSSRFNQLIERVDCLQASALQKPALVVAAVLALTAASSFLVPAVGVAFFPRTDAGQFVINVKAPVGSRLELTSEHVRRVEEVLRKVVPAKELDLVVSNIGMTPDLAAIYTSNAASHTATVQVSLTEDHATDSYLLMQRVTAALVKELPELSVFLQSGGLIDSTLNRGLLSPIDVQVTGSDLQENYSVASKIAQRVRAIPDVEDVLIPQDLDAPALKLEIDRIKAGLSGVTVQEIISNVITALTSNSMIAPGYWIDPASGTDYLLTVQYPENKVRSLVGLEEITSSPAVGGSPIRVDAVSTVTTATAPTEVDHLGLRRVINLYVQPRGEEIGRTVDALRNIVKSVELPPGVRVSIRGAAEEMEKSFVSFGSGLVMALLLVYLILMAQFRSFVDPLLILLAVPPSLIGVVLLFLATGTTFNIMSLMGIILLSGIVISNSILIVDVARRAFANGLPATEAARQAVKIRLRPIAMTSFATLIGLLPLGLKLGTGSEAYAPLALAIIGGLGASLLLTIFIVPAAFVFVYGRVQPARAASVTGSGKAGSTSGSIR